MRPSTNGATTATSSSSERKTARLRSWTKKSIERSAGELGDAGAGLGGEEGGVAGGAAGTSAGGAGEGKLRRPSPD